MDIRNYKIILTDIAKEEIEEVYQYILENLFAKEAANTLMNKIEKSILMLENNPYSCIEIKIKPHNEIYRKLIVDNYVVLYQVEEEHKQVVIYRMIYGKRDYLN